MTILPVIFTATFMRDVTMARRAPVRIFAAPLFFVLIIMVFPLTLGGEPAFLQRMAPGILIAAAMVANIIQLDRLFRDDAEDGTLDAIILSPSPLSLYTAGRIAAHWVLACGPLVILLPLSAVLLHAPLPFIPAVFGIILPATILFTLIGAIAQGVSIGTSIGAVMLAVLSIPLYIPALIFAGAGLLALLNGMDATVPTTLLWAMVALATPITPMITAATLRMARG